MSNTLEVDNKIWTRKRKSTLMMKILHGKTTAAEASREFGLPQTEIEGWLNQIKAGTDNHFSEKNISLIEDELATVLNSKQFVSAPAVQSFLKFVVNEVVAGRGVKIKAYTVATEALGRNSQFDPSSDTIVRTTAGRVRRALEAYYRESATDSPVVISLPKGGYVPSFEFREARSSSPPSSPGWLSRVCQSIFRPGILTAACIFTVIAIGAVAFSWWKTELKALPAHVIIEVLPVDHVGEATQSLATAIDSRLAPALSGIGLAEIFPPGVSPRTNNGVLTSRNPTRNISFILKTSITNADNPVWRWQLVDAESGRLLSTSQEQLTEPDSASIDRAVSKVSFQVLGEGGAVSSSLQKDHRGIFSNQTCLVRAQLMQTVEDASVYPQMRECLELTVAKYPNDASAWATLSTFYTIRTRYYTSGCAEEHAKLIELAAYAAEKAEELAPDAYLTRVALMHLALRQHKIQEFDALQKIIRARYPGDIHLKLRIASRLARLGRGQEALGIYDEAREGWDMTLRTRSADIALAYFVEGEYESAYHQIERTISRQRYVLTLKISILGKLGMADEAQPVISQLVENNPNIVETFYPWFTTLSWARPVLLEIADGLAKAGLVVAID